MKGAQHLCVYVVFVRSLILPIDLPLVLHSAGPRAILCCQADRPDDVGGVVAGEVLPLQEGGRHSVLGEDVAALHALKAERRGHLLALSPLLHGRLRDVHEQSLLLHRQLPLDLEGLAQ